MEINWFYNWLFRDMSAEWLGLAKLGTFRHSIKKKEASLLDDMNSLSLWRRGRPDGSLPKCGSVSLDDFITARCTCVAHRYGETEPRYADWCEHSQELIVSFDWWWDWQRNKNRNSAQLDVVSHKFGQDSWLVRFEALSVFPLPSRSVHRHGSNPSFPFIFARVRYACMNVYSQFTPFPVPNFPWSRSPSLVTRSVPTLSSKHF